MIADVDKDLQGATNLLDVLRRLRMHGFALTTYFKRSERAFIASRAHTKPIEQVVADRPKEAWEAYERLLKKELLAIEIFKKFREIMKKEDKIKER